MLLLVYEIELSVLRHGRCGTFTLELEDHHAIIMARGKEVNLGVRSDDPEPIILSFERLDASPLVQIPNPDCFVLAY